MLRVQPRRARGWDGRGGSAATRERQCFGKEEGDVEHTRDTGDRGHITSSVDASPVTAIFLRLPRHCYARPSCRLRSK